MAQSPSNCLLSQGAPIAVAGLLGTASGIGESARLCVESLRSLSLNPIPMDLSEAFDQKEFDFEGSHQKLPNEPGLLVLHVNAPETERALFELGIRRFHRWKVVGYWAWETTRPPSNWGHGARFLNEVWTPSDFCARAVKKVVECPVRVQPHIVSSPIKMCHPANREVTCLAMADGLSSLHRKNLLGAVQMYQSARAHVPNSKLIVKTRNFPASSGLADRIKQLVRSDSSIEFIDQTLDQEERDALIDRADILISPHRSEGFGLTLAEAMIKGKTVIATGWSGNLDFMSEDSAMLIPYSLVPVSDPSGRYPDEPNQMWAEPDLEAGTKLLVQALRSTDLRMKLGKTARAEIQNFVQSGSWLKNVESVRNT